MTPAVATFLRENPFLVVGDKRSLNGLVVVDDVMSIDESQKESLIERYKTPGMVGLDVRSVKSFDGTPEEGIVIPLDDPTESAGAEPRGLETNE